MAKKIIIFLNLALLLSLACHSPEKNKEAVIVTVGKGTLTLDKLNREIPTTFQDKISQDQINNFIQQWIEAELIYQAALKLGLDMEPDFSYELEKAKRDLLVRKYLERFLSQEEEVTDEEAMNYYEDNKETFKITTEEIKVLHILVATRSEANKVRKRLIKGEDFETVAKEVSLDYADKKRVEMGFFTRNDVIPEIGSRVFSYRVGSITQPIESNFGFHIFKILAKRKPGTYKSFDEVKEQIISRIKSKKRNKRYHDLVIDLRNKMVIKKNDEVLRQLYSDSTFYDQKPSMNQTR